MTERLRILTENKDKLDALANKLLEKEVIFREDLKKFSEKEHGILN
jgi:cell division protease FtsH